MTLRRNLLAGLVNSIWSTMIALAVVPLYLKYLGMEAYGLIGFFVTMQALLGFLDMGFAPTINREVARRSALGNLSEAGNLIHTLAVVCWCIAGAIAILIFPLAPFIAEHWLKSKQLPPQTITNSIMLIGLIVSCRLPIGLYQAVLIGAQRVTVSSGINMVITTIGGLGAVGVLAFISPTIEAFFIWQVCIGFVYVISIRAAAWRIIGKSKRFRFDEDELKITWPFAAGMTGVAISGTILMQLDKVLLSKMLSLDDYGRYMLAMTLANGLLVILIPVFNVIYPRLTSLVVSGDEEKVMRLYRSGACFLAAIVFPAALAVVILAKDILFLWTNNLGLALNVAPILKLLIIGTALNSVMIFPYALQLAHGFTKLPLTIAVSLLTVYAPLVIFFVLSYGVMGGALAWPVQNLIYIIFGTWITHKHVLKGVAFVWLIREIAAPLFMSLVIGFIGWKLIYVEGAYLMNICLITMMAILSMLSITMILQADAVINTWRKYSKGHRVLGDA